MGEHDQHTSTEVIMDSFFRLIAAGPLFFVTHGS
jgi:hypothetical protein